MNISRGVLVLAVLAAGQGRAVAQEAAPATQESSELELFELNDVLKKETTVASTRALTVRETPGIVTVISRDEILASGARDLLDLLMLVPGFAPGVDVEGVVDVGMRGIWGHEGKILLLVDGVEMNELLYSTNQLGLHYPVSQLSSVEIIRGPGSVRYGGYAELAVINVKTLSASELQGADVSVRLGTGDRGEGTRTISAAGGATTERFGGASFSAEAYLGAGLRSDRNYVDPYGSVGAMKDQSELRPAFLNLGASWRDLKLRYLHDGYSYNELDSYGQIAPTVPISFVGDYFDASYALKVSPRLTITPRLSWKRQSPWYVSDDTSYEFWEKTVQRTQGGILAAWDALDTLTLTAGLEAYHDHAWLDTDEIVGSMTQYSGLNDVSYTNVAALAEAQWSSFVGNLIGGLRYEHHSKFGSSIVPRLALTKAFDNGFHFKLLASRAFRAPGIENINAGLDVKPEYTTDLEAEAGYAFTNGLFVSANVFNTIISDPLIYSYDPATDTEYYKNFSQTGARGFEAEVQYRHRRGWAVLSYSFASSAPNEVDVYKVAGESSRVLGMPVHKLTLRGSIRIWRELSFDPSGYLMGDRWGMVGDGQGGTTLQKFNAQVVLNALVSWKNVGGSGFDARAGVTNLLDTQVVYLQPYDGGHPPLPGPGREYMLEVEAHFQ